MADLVLDEVDGTHLVDDLEAATVEGFLDQALEQLCMPSFGGGGRSFGGTHLVAVRAIAGSTSRSCTFRRLMAI